MRVQAARIEEPTGLIPVESVNAIELFTGGGLDSLLAEIENEVSGYPVDLETDKGRKEIASVAYKVSRSKVVIDEAGKSLVSDWKKQAAEVDVGRKKARDFLDALRDRVRQPLTDWEAEQKRIEEERRLAAELEQAHAEALRENEIFDREAEIRRKEEEIAKQEAERLEKERQEREAAERKAREEQIAREAEERAKKEAAEALKREQEAREKAEREAKEAEERRLREAQQAEERAKRQAEEAAERERRRAANEAAERERQRRAEEERKRQEEAARAADKANRDKINAAAISALVAEGIAQKTAEKVVQLVGSGSIPAMSIRY